LGFFVSTCLIEFNSKKKNIKKEMEREGGGKYLRENFFWEKMDILFCSKRCC
jgi:hypothetical protein